ncbi:hypothetical protein GGS23DRAFT_596014 [Durotheca rogersii]|uniref:uncharacterized protein n=1 Tax=Durotheca rogersii TaxID=419775 RepID=UPI00221EAB5D|nr:uncharacterized protein GGS23DRAFT_596014 [Durotheca rogersii]KAI5864382.1 hypothetical protein GGS23DRAFT_596014 [Durotheca rogersii]
MARQLELRANDAKGHTLVGLEVLGIFAPYLRPDSTASAASAASAISSFTLAQTDSGRSLDDGFLFGLWDSVVGVAEQVPHDHPAQDRVVSVLRELTLLPDTGVAVWDARLWADLPVLGAALRERLNGREPSADAAEQARADVAWVRFHAFSARLVGAGVARLENQAIWMLRDALEEEGDAAAPATATATTLNRDLAAAAVYIEYAGPILVEALAAGPPPPLTDERRRVLRGGSLLRGVAGLTRDRWDFWRRRFREQAPKATSEEARAMALRAARLMDVWSETRLQRSA